MKVSTSAFYAWAKTPEDTDKKIQQKQLEAKAIELFEENKNVYGSRRLSEAFIKGRALYSEAINEQIGLKATLTVDVKLEKNSRMVSRASCC